MPLLPNEMKDKVRIITPDDGYHYFFAYYDMRATGNGINERHLCHRVSFFDRLPTSDDVCELGYIDGGKFVKFAETTAWNFQQGAMLQYHPTRENTVFYNVCENGKFMTVTHNFETGEKKYTDMATATVSSDGKYGLSVNFGRIFEFRAGYGYAGFVDRGAEVNAPEDDGVFLTNMETGKSELLISYKDMLSETGFTDNDKILVNHITFNTDGTKYVMLVRDLRKDGSGWDTSMVIGDLHGNIKTIVKRKYVSHYYWLTPTKILAHSTPDDLPRALFTFDVEDGSYVKLANKYFGGAEPDIHCSISPDGKYVIGDGYPNEGYRAIVSIKVETGESKIVLRSKTITPPTPDIRCDLHARFVLGGKYVSFDTTQNGKREIALFPVECIEI